MILSPLTQSPIREKANLQHKESKTEVFVIPKSSVSSKLSNGTFAQMDKFSIQPSILTMSDKQAFQLKLLEESPKYMILCLPLVTPLVALHPCHSFTSLL